ncbi:MAG TPA: ornithine cyclodeaminase family protein, partial [Vicinamibacteria bacterium]|nr:ornithine cyclodeaminase family protein [Vicinamibacteria bacterium]
MKVKVLSGPEVRDLLPMPACIEAMADALARLAKGEVHQPLRLVFRPPDAAGLMAFMPAYASGPGAAFGVKAIGIFPGNATRGMDTHQGMVCLFDGETGELMALMNGAAVTAIRTAAVSGVATRALAREDAGDLAILGSGTQARTHLRAVASVR